MSETSPLPTDARIVLEVLLELPKNEWKSKFATGRLGVRNKRLAELTGLSPDQLNLAVAWLEKREAVHLIRGQGDQPFQFRWVQQLTSQGRLLLSSYDSENQMSRRTEPLAGVTNAEWIWLKEAMRRRNSGESLAPSAIRSSILESLPRGFRATDINRALWKGERPTLLGLALMEPDDDLVQDADRVIRAVQAAIKERPEAEEVLASDVAARARLSHDRAGFILSLLSFLPAFHSQSRSTRVVASASIAASDLAVVSDADSIARHVVYVHDTITISEDREPGREDYQRYTGIQPLIEDLLGLAPAPNPAVLHDVAEAEVRPEGMLSSLDAVPAEAPALEEPKDYSRSIPGQGVNNLWYRHQDTDAVIVFVHGIMSDSRMCWLAPDNESPESARYWPELIASDSRFNEYSIYLGGFATGLSSTIYDASACEQELYRALIRPDELTGKRVLDHERIVFVCHSTGGIVVRHMLEREVVAFQQKTVGLLLIASPSFGSRLASALSIVSRLFGNKLARQLEWGNKFLKDVDVRFKQTLHEDRIPRFYGREGLEQISPGLWLRYVPFLNRFLLVTEESGGRYFGQPVLLRHTDHSGTVKPVERSHSGYELLVDFVREFRERFQPPRDPNRQRSMSPPGALTGKSHSPASPARPSAAPHVSAIPTPAASSQVVVVYAAADEVFALGLADRLRTRTGISAWTRAWEVLPGDRTIERLFGSIAQARVCVAILTKAALDEPLLLEQIAAMFHRRLESPVRVVPVLVGDTAPPLFLKDTEPIRIAYDVEFDAAVELLARVLSS